MKSQDVVELLQFLEGHGIEVVVDGGWGVDALLGEQTREHSDLDIAMKHGEVSKLRRLLGEPGYREVQMPDTWECNFVLMDGQGRRLDVHSFAFDENGNNIFGVDYKPEHLQGSGIIAGHPVKCIPVRLGANCLRIVVRKRLGECGDQVLCDITHSPLRFREKALRSG